MGTKRWLVHKGSEVLGYFTFETIPLLNENWVALELPDSDDGVSDWYFHEKHGWVMNGNEPKPAEIAKNENPEPDGKMYALVQSDGMVVNATVLSDTSGFDALDGIDAVRLPYETLPDGSFSYLADIGWYYRDGEFVAPNATVGFIVGQE